MAKSAFKSYYIEEEDLPDHLKGNHNIDWGASFKIEAISIEGNLVLITMWRKAQNGKIIETIIEMEEQETITLISMADNKEEEE